MNLTFKKVQSEQEIKNVYDHNIEAFSDSPDFKWNLEEIKKEIKDGWELFSVQHEAKIAAAVFLKKEGFELLSKNTAVKSEFQGHGISHEMKEFIEKRAKESKLKSIKHYCAIDNFRMYTLNERHGYKKTENKLSNGRVVEWIKSVE